MILSLSGIEVDCRETKRRKLNTESTEVRAQRSQRQEMIRTKRTVEKLKVQELKEEGVTSTGF
jgi:hypothetical protein